MLKGILWCCQFIAALLLTQGLAWPELSHTGRAGTSGYLDRLRRGDPVPILACVVAEGAGRWRMVLREVGRREGGLAVDGNIGHHL